MKPQEPPIAAPMAAPPGVAWFDRAIWLETRHWLLMTTRPGYARMYADLHAQNAEQFRLAMSPDPRMAEPSFWEPVLANEQNASRLGYGLHLAGFLKSGPSVRIGCVIDFSNIVHDEFQCCWLGFRMDHALEGMGLMHEALSAATAAMFERYGLHRIKASHLPENERSARALRRLGFCTEGYARDFMKIDGRWRDNVLTALLEPGARVGIPQHDSRRNASPVQ